MLYLVPSIKCPLLNFSYTSPFIPFRSASFLLGFMHPEVKYTARDYKELIVIFTIALSITLHIDYKYVFFTCQTVHKK